MKNLLRDLACMSVILAALTITITHLNRPAEAQGSSQTIVAVNGSDNQGLAVTPNGDVYRIRSYEGESFTSTYIGNVFYGTSPIATQPTTWSGVKTHIKN